MDSPYITRDELYIIAKMLNEQHRKEIQTLNNLHQFEINHLRRVLQKFVKLWTRYCSESWVKYCEECTYFAIMSDKDLINCSRMYEKQFENELWEMYEIPVLCNCNEHECKSVCYKCWKTKHQHHNNRIWTYNGITFGPERFEEFQMFFKDIYTLAQSTTNKFINELE